MAVPDRTSRAAGIPALVAWLTSAVVVVGVSVLLLGRPAPGLANGLPAVSRLPAVNAFLNATSAALLTAGFVFIRRRDVAAHRASMLAAFAVSALFLACYVVYHLEAGSVPFQGRGWIRPVYFALLLSHVVLAALVLPLALATLRRAWTGRFERHRRIARWTLPIWLYVSVTGVVIYLLLYHL